MLPLPNDEDPPRWVDQVSSASDESMELESESENETDMEMDDRVVTV